MEDFRCSNCKKLLGKIEGKAEIVCPRCKVLNAFNATEEMLSNPEIEEQYKTFCWCNGIKPHTNERP